MSGLSGSSASTSRQGHLHPCTTRSPPSPLAEAMSPARLDAAPQAVTPIPRSCSSSAASCRSQELLGSPGGVSGTDTHGEAVCSPLCKHGADDELLAHNQASEPGGGLDTPLLHSSEGVHGLVLPGTFVLVSGRVMGSRITPISDGRAVLARNFFSLCMSSSLICAKIINLREGQNTWGQLLLLVPLFCLLPSFTLNSFFFHLVRRQSGLFKLALKF